MDGRLLIYNIVSTPTPAIAFSIIARHWENSWFTAILEERMFFFLSNATVTKFTSLKVYLVLAELLRTEK